MKKMVIYYTSLIGLFIFIIFLRIYRLDELPLSMHIDEAGLGLNAWSLANYGTDRYGNFLPVCPINFYGEQSGFYSYFCAVFIKIWGLNIYTLRLPAVIMGVIAVLFGALICKEKWGNKGFFGGLVLLGIFPYYIMNSRFALDCNAMLGMISIAFYCLIRLIKRIEKEPQKNYYGAFALTGFLLGLVLYTYIIAALVVAVFCVLFGIYYLCYQKENKGHRLKQLVFMAIPLIIMVLPLGLVVCVNYFGWQSIETAFFSVPKLPLNRTEEVGFSLFVLPEKIKGILHTLTSDGKYGSSDTYWTMYWWSVPFVIWGGLLSVYEAIRNRNKQEHMEENLMLFLVIAECVMFVLCGWHNYHINGIFVALSFFCMKGILNIMFGFKNPKLQKACICVVLVLYMVTFVGFSGSYFGTQAEAPYQVYGGVEEALSLLTEEQREKEIYILDEVGEFYFLSNPISPDEYMQGCNELGYIKDYKNLHFYEPLSLEDEYIYVCSKASGRYYGLVAEKTWEVKETEYYYVLYR